jgi:hypothetical protein
MPSLRQAIQLGVAVVEGQTANIGVANPEGLSVGSQFISR